jgi:tetratricopeptide (TPR) repeat protein
MKVYQAFGLKKSPGLHSQQVQLMALFAQYKPELLQQPTITESENQVTSTVTASNTSTSDNQDVCTTEYDPNFVGRKDAMSALDNLINKGAKIIQIIAPGGTGKTILASKYLESKFKTVLEFPIGKERKDIASIDNLLEFNLRKLGEEPGKELMESLQRLKQKLQNQEIGILIDNLEPALDASGKFIEQHRSYVELLRILTDSSIKSITLITSRERLCECLDITLYKLPSLNIEAWYEYWHHQEINPDTSILTEIHKVYGGNALAMKVLCNPIINDFNGDIIAYWQENKTEENLEIETAVANLIKEQFERLAHINLDAYNLLCRMGCYRYQDVSTVPEQGLCCLLWDVEENKHQRIIKVLKERGLVEFNNDNYWLHPIIRQEAIDRLRNSNDWQKANIQAAEFWTESVKTVEIAKDALTAFESYYHYFNIEDYQRCGDIIAKERLNKWDKDEPLMVSFYRLGLMNQIAINIETIVDKIDDNYNKGFTLARLYNNLGDIYWLTGYLSKAIKIHQKCQRIATQFNLKKFQAVSYFNIALCLIDFREIKASIKFLNKSLPLSERYQEANYILSGIYFCLAFIHSCLEDQKNAILFREKFYSCQEIQNDSWCVGYGYLFMGATYNNLGEIKQSFEMYNKAIDYAEESHYPQVKAKALTGLAELYRVQNDLKKALTHHQESIAILERIDGKCDLAEAYFQQALTYQKMGDKANSEEYFHKAMYLWSSQQMDAPKQIERVLKAMNCES